MELHDLSEFFKLSAVLNYQLAARGPNWNALLRTIVGTKQLEAGAWEALRGVLEALYAMYGAQRRRLGLPMIIHPLRSAALLARVLEKPNVLELSTILLHDRFEDIDPTQFAAGDWSRLDEQLQKAVARLHEVDRWFLMERLQWLTRRPEESYYQYVGRLFTQAARTPEAIRAKLADRLDNTLDMRIDIEDPLEDVDFFETVFQLLFANYFRGYHPKEPHPPPSALNGAHRLYQLFKNTVLMSIMRQRGLWRDDEPVRKLFDALARASMKEAQRIILHIIAYHETSIDQVRALMMETMEYVRHGGIDAVTLPMPGSRLDGLFMSRFGDTDKVALEEKLQNLYQDKPLMIEAALAFIVIFLSFIDDPDYYVHGINEQGIHPQPSA
ncbi:MAG: hypothetical protein ONB07_11990 [candidate division KSB1 bacterium]|nr:hypothetical protein [candidate division KSB1 bacterium]MDZ7413876.1 hypothetical protein [candidate division KSB1 bacterium]